ncbi:hypothetical protein AtDm6_1472 [Acetobacter tropicalis]|uniref:Uncharacterized protein n=1 Tax=Acetobacter tropicalis TaxID=104102 RepID=A0A094ZP84_9PROT|nr:hypothetical protein AtDm6_1472 [Acetobacter tropicalis]
MVMGGQRVLKELGKTLLSVFFSFVPDALCFCRLSGKVWPTGV